MQFLHTPHLQFNKLSFLLSLHLIVLVSLLLIFMISAWKFVAEIESLTPNVPCFNHFWVNTHPSLSPASSEGEKQFLPDERGACKLSEIERPTTLTSPRPWALKQCSGGWLECIEHWLAWHSDLQVWHCSQSQKMQIYMAVCKLRNNLRIHCFTMMQSVPLRHAFTNIWLRLWPHLMASLPEKAVTGYFSECPFSSLKTQHLFSVGAKSMWEYL